MAVLTTSVDPASETARANRAGLEALLAEHEVQLDLARIGGGERYLARHRARGKLTARERIELLLDEGSPYLELSPLAAWGSEFHVGGAMVTGIGVVEGIECVVIAQDPTVRGGSMNPYTLKKNLRALEIARVNRLPLINLVESGGADVELASPRREGRELEVRRALVEQQLDALARGELPARPVPGEVALAAAQTGEVELHLVLGEQRLQPGAIGPGGLAPRVDARREDGHPRMLFSNHILRKRARPSG